MSGQLAHFAKNTFLGCIDDRLVKSHADFIGDIGGAFTITLAGGGLALIAQEDRTVALKEVVLAYRINKINHVYLESHTDCGAYRLAGITFGSSDQEVDRLYGDLDLAAESVQSALQEAGAAPDEIEVTVRVVDSEGSFTPRHAT